MKGKRKVLRCRKWKWGREGDVVMVGTTRYRVERGGGLKRVDGLEGLDRGTPVGMEVEAVLRDGVEAAED